MPRITLALLVLGCLTTLAHGDKPYGIPKRVPWTTSKMVGSPDPPAPYKLVRVFPKMSFKNPVVLTNAPGTSRLFVVELAGKVHSFVPKACGPRPAGSPAKSELVVDLKQGNKEITRVYGLTFHPKFKQNRYCYICYVTKAEQPKGTKVARFTVSKSEPPTIDFKTEKVILEWKSGGHNGGCLKFGPDGYLYVSTGDGAGAFPPDTLNTGQNVNDLLASVLRIDVDKPANGKAYGIPKDNPFVGKKNARGEVWSYGHRNPWKMSFDSQTGDLWVGDVGWEMWEMIYRVQKGDNYGWSVLEHTQSVHPERSVGPTPIVPPTIAHAHTESRSITGGFVYRGKRLPELNARYIYGDYVTGKLWAALHDGKKVTKVTELLDSPLQIICFGVDNRNELYVVTYDGTIHRIVKNNTAKANRDFPKKLSQTGLFSSTKDHKVAPGVIPYSVIAEPWMDGATAKRYIALPGKSTLGIHEKNNVQKGMLKGEWVYPLNAVLMKTIFLKTADGKNRRVETQILHRVADHQWNAYNYVWNDEQTDAVFLEGPGKDRVFYVPATGRRVGSAHQPKGQRQTKVGTAHPTKRRQTWHHAGRTECLMCHTTRGGSVYGFLPEQLDRNHNYGKVTDNQLRTLGHIALFSKVPKGKRPELVKPESPFAGVQHLFDLAARSYLHVNCATCHRRGGGGTSKFELLAQKISKDKYLFDARPTQGAFGIANAKVIEPGDPFRSVLLYRMAKLGRGRMPHLGSRVVDANGLFLMARWISSTSAKRSGTGKNNRAQEWAKTQNKMFDDLALKLKDDGKSAEPVVKELLSTIPGALFAAYRIHNWRKRGLILETNAGFRSKLIQAGSSHADPRIRDLFEPFLPEEKRTKRLGTAVDAVALLKLKGDIAAGRKLFHRTAGVSCINCHKIQGKGKDVGPDLSHIGKKNSRAQLLESILKPSQKIDKKYVLYLVETSKGLVKTGLLVKKDTKEVVLKDKDGKAIHIPAKQVELIVPQRKSIMPELLLRDMTARQVADLLAYLASLK